MKIFAIAATLGAVNALSAVEAEYMNYIARFNKIVGNAEEFASRLEKYMEVDAFIQAHNSMPSNYTVGHNQLSDRLASEIEAMNGYRQGPIYASKEPTLFDTSMNADSVDWVTAGAVTPVKN